MSQIHVQNLCKEFKQRKKGTGFRRIIGQKEISHALDNVSFDIDEGDFVAYIGPNGSGKSTTIKILTGVLVPTRGTVECMGYTPWKQRIKYTNNIGVVFGQKSLLWWDLRVIDSLLLYRDIYQLSQKEFKSRIDYFNDLIQIEPLLEKRVRKMSFGERMRAELVAALLHKPKMLFLDEPTIGMDIVAKERIREFLKEVNEREKTTILLTTHDIGDIEALCERAILLDKGKKIYDGSIENLKEKYVTSKDVLITHEGVKDTKKFLAVKKKCNVLDEKKDYIKLSIDIKEHSAAEIIEELMKTLKVDDMNVSDPNLTTIIREIYKEGKIK